MRRAQQPFVQQGNCKRMKWNYGEGEQHPPPNMAPRGVGRGTNMAMRQQQGEIVPNKYGRENINPMDQKNVKPGGMMNNANGLDPVQRAKMITNELVQNTEEMRAKIVEKRTEIETKTQRMEFIKAKREAMNAERARLQEEYHNKLAVLAKGKERFTATLKKVPDYIQKAKAITEKREDLVRRINDEVSGADKIISEYRELTNRAELMLEKRSRIRDDVIEALAAVVSEQRPGLPPKQQSVKFRSAIAK